MDNNWKKKEDTSQTPEHPDYRDNLRSAETFAQNVEKSIPEGMKVKVSDKVAMVFSYKPPSEYPMGCFATPVSLNQSRYQFSESMTNTMNSYAEMVKKVTKQIQEKK